MLMLSSTVRAQDYLGKSLEMFGSLKMEDDSQIFMRCKSAIDHDRSISDEVRLQLRVKYLIIIHQFLKTHTKPEGQTWMNLLPPDGGVSGKAPEDVKDPVLRAKYVKMIAENNALSEAQNKYSNIAANYPGIAETIATHISDNKEKLKSVSDLLNQNTKTKEEAKELMELIDQAAVKRGVKTPAWEKSTNK